MGQRVAGHEDHGPGPEIGDRVGAFRLKELLGKGGMGAVYLAEQLEPVRREVALKLLRSGLLDPAHIARFAVEQQALARMSHPAIAQVYDAGTTPDGRPYFAMEHVPGEIITDFCSSHGLELRQRLELFAKVCWGVQHAHQKGIIHRDLKPSNILVRLVDDQPSPKIIDFGIATAARSTGDQAPSRRPSVSGTPAYMSPEQADLDEADIDTRSDTYSLGAVLYELLTGATPVPGARLLDTPMADLRRVLLAAEIEPPSRRLEASDGALAALATTPGDRRRVLQRLRSELDSIVLKAVAADRSQRYQSTAALAQDVEAFLAGQPVQAVPPTLRYRLSTLARRHRALLAGGAAVVLSLLVGLALATWGFLQAREQRDRALEAEALAKVEVAKVEQIAGFTQGILAGVDPAIAGALDKTLVRKILEGASDRIGSELVGQPEVAAAIHRTIGVTYSALGEYTPALKHLAAAQTLLEQELGRDHPETLANLVELALVYRLRGEFDSAMEALTEATAGLRATRGDKHQETLTAINNLASLNMLQGHLEEAERLYQEALEGSRQTLGSDDRNTLSVANNLGLLYSDNGEFELAEPLLLEVLEKSRATLGSDHPDTINSLNNLAALYEMQGRFEDAEKVYLEALDRGRKVLGAEHPETLNMMNNLAVLYRNARRFEEAERLHRQVLEGCRRVLGPDHPDTLNSLNNLAFLQNGMGRSADAAELLAVAAEAARRTLPPDSVLAGRIFSNYGWVLTDLGRFAEAEAVLVQARDLFERVVGPDHDLTRTATERLEDLERRRRP